ncbi:MAG: DUF1579 family protein [Phycisphaerales bacterium]|nr:DUF1579 family protein [Phycisphaerales bacterium]
MNLKDTLPFLAGIAAASGIAVLVAAGPEHDSHGMDPVTTDEMNEMMEMSPEDMMAAMAKMSEPGEHHKELGEMVGNWHAKTSFIMDPSAPPMEGEGEMSVKWILGGRFLQSNFKMDFMGQPFEGLSFMGYDNAHGEYVSTWMDSMTTKITYMTGEKEDGALVMHGISTTPMGDNPMKIVTTSNEDGTVTDKFYDQMPDGTWMNSGTIVYTRK